MASNAILFLCKKIWKQMFNLVARLKSPNKQEIKISTFDVAANGSQKLLPFCHLKFSISSNPSEHWRLKFSSKKKQTQKLPLKLLMTV